MADCTQIGDYVFLLDSSGSIVNDDVVNWGLMKDFMVRFANHLRPGRLENHYGLVQFSTSATVRWGLDRYYDEIPLADAFLALRNDYGETNMAAAFIQARQNVFGRGGDRPSVPNIAVIITDGRSQPDPTRTVPEATNLKQSGVKVIAVGIGSQVDRNELDNIATNPSEDVIVARDFADLQDQLGNLLDVACFIGG